MGGKSWTVLRLRLMHKLAMSDIYNDKGGQATDDNH